MKATNSSHNPLMHLRYQSSKILATILSINMNQSLATPPTKTSITDDQNPRKQVTNHGTLHINIHLGFMHKYSAFKDYFLVNFTLKVQ